MDIIHSDINRIKGRHSRESGNPDNVPAEAGNHHSGIWIPPYQVRGRLSQARNDKLHNTYMVIYRNQSGAALVIALVMMIVLTLIGLASIFTSTFEIKISGNKRCSTDAFYATDTGIQVLKANVQNLSPNNPNPYEPFIDDPTHNPNPTNAILSATITYDPSMLGAPRGYGISATNFEFEHFVIVSTGETCANPIPTTTTIQEKVVRLIPTSQGGQ